MERTPDRRRSLELNRKAFRVSRVLEPGFAFPQSVTALDPKHRQPGRAKLLLRRGHAIVVSGPGYRAAAEAP